MAVEHQRLEFKARATDTQRESIEASPALEAYCSLAEACTAFNPAQRPTASEVVSRLQRLLNQTQGGFDAQPTQQSPGPDRASICVLQSAG